MPGPDKDLVPKLTDDLFLLCCGRGKEVWFTCYDGTKLQGTLFEMMGSSMDRKNFDFCVSIVLGL